MTANTLIKTTLAKTSTCSDYQLSDLDKSLLNLLQHGLPVCEQPFKVIAEEISSAEHHYTEQQVLEQLQHLLDNRILSRFGPMFDAACLGGAFTLAALSVPEQEFDKVTEQVNSFAQIAHNYKRNHDFNMWFVIGCESEQEVDDVIRQIEAKTGYPVLNVPKLEEYYVGLYLHV